MSTNDILTLVLCLIGLSILLWMAIKTRKTNITEEF